MNRNQKLAIVLITCAALVLGSTVMFGPLDMNAKDINDLGTLTVWTDVGMVKIIEGETAYRNNGLRVTLLTTWEGQPTATLYIGGQPIEVGESRRLETDKITEWTFTLDSVPEGTNLARVGFGGMYSPDRAIIGSTYDFYVESGQAPTYDPPVIDSLADMTASVGETVSLTWWYTYSGPASVVVTLDGETVRNTTNTLTPGEQPISASRYFDEVGVHEFVLTITPDTGVDITTDSVTVTVEDETPTTTTKTDTTTETGTATETPTTTTTDEEPPSDADYTLLGVGAIGAVLILILLIRRRR
jgi:hypothetical protein